MTCYNIAPGRSQSTNFVIVVVCWVSPRCRTFWFLCLDWCGVGGHRSIAQQKSRVLVNVEGFCSTVLIVPGLGLERDLIADVEEGTDVGCCEEERWWFVMKVAVKQTLDVAPAG